MRYYVDTAIWRDYLENRHDRFRPLGDWALDFFKKAEERGDELLASKMVVLELKRAHTDSGIDDMMVTFKVRFVEAPPGLFAFAHRLARARAIPEADALHALVARREDAVLVTRDKDFIEVLDLVDVRKPEELF
jgi:hypothetical protein